MRHFFMQKENKMKEKLAAIKVNLNLLLNRINEMNIDEQVNYEVEQKLDDLNKKVYELSDLIEEIEALEEL